MNRKNDETSWVYWLARHGRLGADAADAGRKRLRAGSTDLLYYLTEGWQRSGYRAGNSATEGRAQYRRAQGDGYPCFLPGGRLYQRSISQVASGGLERLLDRRRLDIAYGK